MVTSAQQQASSQAETVRAFRDFARTHLTGHDAEFDAQPEPPLDLYRPLHKAGLMNWWLPARYGGAGVSLEESIDIVSELAYADAGSAFTLFISILTTMMVELFGSSELRDEFLTALVRNGGYAAGLGSERGVGSELTNTGTIVSRQGDSAVINGDKFFSANADFADFLVVIAKSAEASSAFHTVVVPRGTPGIRIVQRWDTIGLRSSGVYQVSFENCTVPAGNILGGHGLKVLEIALNSSRVLMAATAVGVARRIRDLCLDYAKTKSLDGKTLLENAIFAGKAAQMEIQIEVMRNQCLAAAREHDEIMATPDPAATFVKRGGALRSVLAAKMFCGQAGWEIASVGSEMFGGLGYTTESVISKLLRDIRYVSIVEGGDDVLRQLIFRRFVLPAGRRI